MKVFAYGTLKSGFFNHYLLAEQNDVSLLGIGTTVDKYPLVIGTKYHLPYLLDFVGKGTSATPVQI